MASTLVTPPQVAPVTLAQTKTHLRISHDDEDALIEELIEAATRFMADNDGICCIRQTWRYYISDVSLPRSVNRYPVSSMGAVIGYDRDGNASAILPNAVQLYHRKRPATLSFDGAAINEQAANGADADIVFGFGETATEVPDTLRRAILVLVAHWYAFRGDVLPAQQPFSIPDQYRRLVQPYRRIGAGG